MYLFGRKEIGVRDYNLHSISVPKARSKVNGGTYAPLEVTPLRLSISLAKAILTRDPTNFYLALEVTSCFIRLQQLVEPRNTTLAFRDGLRGLHEDFAFRWRVNELAQALSVQFAQDALGFPLIINYKGYLQSRRYENNVAKSPDFLMCMRRGEGAKPALLEAKGICREKPVRSFKNSLREALDQSELGNKGFQLNDKRHPAASTYGVAIEFAETYDPWSSSLHFVKQDAKTPTELENPLHLMRYYYAAWFAWLGHVELASQLACGDEANFEYLSEEVFYAGQSFMMIEPDQWLMHRYGHMWPFHHHRLPVRFGIATDVWKLLCGYTDYQLFSDGFGYDVISNAEVELFRDGTVAFYDT